MAIRTACPRCGKRFSAPEDYHGKKIDCPRCHHRCVVRTLEEEAELRAREDRFERKREEDRRKIELLERLERSESDSSASGAPYYERFQTGLHGVRNYYPGQPSRFRRLRSLSDFLLFAAYLQVAIALVLVGILIALKASGDFESTVGFAIALCGTTGIGLLAFFSLKFFGEVAFLLSDVGDQQNDLVQLLLDIRSNTDEVTEADSKE